MLYLWVGIPIILSLTHFLQTKGSGRNSVIFGAFMACSLVGMIAGTMLTATVINEINNHVYVLFAVRPFKRSKLLLAKHLALFISVEIAFILVFLLWLVIDLIRFGPEQLGVSSGDAAIAFIISLCLNGLMCSLGILIGVSTRSLYAGIILFFILNSNIQVGITCLLEKIFLQAAGAELWANALIFLFSGLGISLLLLMIGLRIFSRMQL